MNDEYLSEDQKAVLRQGATEAPFSGQYLNCKDEGVYTCAGCGAELFSSETKFDSGSGWPSFDDALPGAVKKVNDESHGMVRTEVVCAQCGGHLGHIFDDGPKETTGTRYCINSLSLELSKKDKSNT